MNRISDDVVGLVSAAAEGKILNKLKYVQFIVENFVKTQLFSIFNHFCAITNIEMHLNDLF